MKIRNISLNRGLLANKTFVLTEFTVCGEVIRRDVHLGNLSQDEVEFLKDYICDICPSFYYERHEYDVVEFIESVVREVEKNESLL